MSSFDAQTTKSREGRELKSFTVVDARQVRAKDKNIDQILSYVEEKTGGKRFAKRSDIQPSELKDLLPDICFFIPRYGNDGVLDDVDITLMGTNVVSFYGELTGQNVKSHPSPVIAERILACVSKTINNRRPTFAEAASLSPDQNYLAVKALYVPLSEDGQLIDRLLVYVRVFGKSLLEDE